MQWLNWNEMTEAERFAFCDEHMDGLLRTALPWDELSPTTQALLKTSGIKTKGIWEA